MKMTHMQVLGFILKSLVLLAYTPATEHTVDVENPPFEGHVSWLHHGFSIRG
jgi:hypothetical protein